MSSTRLATTIAAGILIAAAVIFGAYLAFQPQDCGLQLLEETSGERLPSDVSSQCRE